MTVCGKCGEVHEPVPRCQGHAKSTGKQCRARAIAGGTVCVRNHGGAAPQVAAAAAVRLVEARADAAVRDLGGQPVADPVAELLRVAGAIVRLEEFLRAEVESRTSLETFSVAQGAEMIPLVRALERALDRSARVLVEINRLGLQEKALAIDAAQGQLVATVVRAVLEAAGLSPSQWEVVDVELPRQLLAAEGRAS